MIGSMFRIFTRPAKQWVRDKTQCEESVYSIEYEAGGVAARRRCGPTIPGEASAADALESIQGERTPAAVIGRRQGQLCRCFRQVLESKRSGSSSLRRIYAPSTSEVVAYTQWTPMMAKARRKCAAAERRLCTTIGQLRDWSQSDIRGSRASWDVRRLRETP